MSESKYSVTLGQIIKEFDLEVLCAAPNYEQVPLHTVDVNRPGLPLSGFFEHFDTKRLLQPFRAWGFQRVDDVGAAQGEL